MARENQCLSRVSTYISWDRLNWTFLAINRWSQLRFLSLGRLQFTIQCMPVCGKYEASAAV